MTETEDFSGESVDFEKASGSTPETGEDISGDEGELEIEIPAANYGAGMIATAQDADLVAANIKDGANIFGVVGEYAPEDGDDVTGTDGQLAISIPAANYPAGKTATAQDADLVAANIKSGAEIFGVTGTHEGETDKLPLTLETGLSHAIT